MSDIAPPSPAAAPHAARRQWWSFAPRALAPLAWLIIAAAGVQVALAALWSDDLSDRGAAGLLVAWIGFMAVTFAYHAGVAMLAPLAFALATRRWAMAAAALVVGVIGAGPELWPTLARPAAASHEGPSLKVMSINVLYGRTDAVRLLAQIDRENPDVVAIQEWTPQAHAALAEALAARFPHAELAERGDAFGQALFSRAPFLSSPRRFPPIAGFAEPQITAEVALAGRPLRLVNVHLLPPIGPRYFTEQRRGAARLGEWASSSPPGSRPDLLVGDFNAVTRSPILAPLLAAGYREAHAAAGPWRGSTWPRLGVLRFFPGVRIDHAVVGPRLRVLEARTGEDVGSDHRPVIVRVGWDG